jgi:formyltetrahydrofolate deformylase
MIKNSVLLINAPDEIGLVYKTSGILFQMGLNIVHNSEFVDKNEKKFFMRTEIAGDFDSKYLLEQLEKSLPDRSNITIQVPKKKKVVLLVTKEAHCLGDLLIRHEFNELNAEIVAVVSNHQFLEALTKKFNIPFHYVDHQDLSRELHEEKIFDVVDSYNPEYLVLAKYMRILTPNFVKHYKDKIVNIHHSFLPAFIGAKPYLQAYNRGVKIIGATAHFVNNDLDEGPIIAQEVIPVDHSDNADDMAYAGHDVEKIVLAKALRLVFDDKVFVHKNKTIIFDA